MARAEIPFVVSKATGTVSGATANYAVSGASVLVNLRGGGPATVYAGETGTTTLANPLTTTAEGRIDGWLNEGSYDLVISGSGITTMTQPIEVTRGDGAGLIAAGAIGTTQLQNSSVTFAKLGSDVVGSIIPPGIVWPYAGTVLPSGWIWADGKAYDGTNATYTPLWNALGTSWGGTGQANFFAPDFRGRSLVGSDNFGTNGSVVRSGAQRGQYGGSITHVHTTPDHTHTSGSLNAAAHQHQHASPISVRSGQVRVRNPADANNDWPPTSSYDIVTVGGDSAVEIGAGGNNSTEIWVVTSTAVGAAVNGSTGGASWSSGQNTSAVSSYSPFGAVGFIVKL